MIYTEKRFGRAIRRKADRARDQGDFRTAASLFEAFLQFEPDNAAIHVQCAHMYKEAHDLVAAEQHYQCALKLTPDDADLALQLGHFEKMLGRYDRAADFYAKAAATDPALATAAIELENLKKSKPWAFEAIPSQESERDVVAVEEPEVFGRPRGGFISPELLPVGRDDLLLDFREEFVLTRLGRGQRTRWADCATLRGVDAIRGHIFSRAPLFSIDIYIGGQLVGEFPLIQAPLRRARHPGIAKYIFNAWIDVTELKRGRVEVVMSVKGLTGNFREGIEWRRDQAVVAEPIPVADYGYSDGVLPLAPDDGRSLEERINAAPSIVHPSSTRGFPAKLDAILILRTDQLGDMVVSVPALRRLREIAPGAKLVGLLTAANAALARTLDVFDDIIVIDFPDDLAHRRRVMSLSEQVRLRQLLEPYRFDLAIDLAVSGVSNKLMTLSGATYTMGFGLGNARWMTMGIDIATHDVGSNNDIMQHSARTRLLVEALGVWLESGAQVVRRTDLDPAVLVPYGIAPGERFALIHSGARISFSRWPHYATLAARIHRELGIKVVFLADGPNEQDGALADLIADGRVVYMDGKIPFDHFDALASFCSVFVGNDSGPKHLASLRGAKVVSIHSARTNWKEWGQELGGVIISRKVPCAGCSIHHEPEECGKDFACVRSIKLEEVLNEVRRIVNVTGDGD